MQTLKEKREAIMQNEPDKAKMVLAKLAFVRDIPRGDYVMHKRSKYTMIMPVTCEPSTSKGKRKIEDVIDIQDSPKKQRVGKEIEPDEPQYSPSQFPIHIGDEQVVVEQLLQLGSLGEIAYTYEETQEGMPEEPPNAEMDLTNGELKGQEMDLIVKRASEEFLADSNFVTSGAFIQFLWKQNIDQFKTRCEQRKSEQPLKNTTQVEEEVKQEMMEEFKVITAEKGREMVAKAGVLILSEWDIVDALVLDAVRKETKPME